MQILYTSNFHFRKKFDQNGNLIDSWGTVGSQDGQFLHAHGITIDSKDNVCVSDAENCNRHVDVIFPLTLELVYYQIWMLFYLLLHFCR
jgi:hypothetical protein